MISLPDPTIKMRHTVLSERKDLSISVNEDSVTGLVIRQ